MDLALSAVHHDQIRKDTEGAQRLVHMPLPEIFCLFDPVGKTSRQHLLQRGIVVGAFYGFDPELAVIRRFRLPFLEDDHGTYRFHSGRVGDIVSLQAGDMSDPQNRGDLLHRADGPAFFQADPLPVLLQSDPCVLVCHLYQAAAHSSLRYLQVHTASAPAAQPFLNQFLVFDPAFQHQFFRKERSLRIELAHEHGQDAAFHLTDHFALLTLLLLLRGLFLQKGSVFLSDRQETVVSPDQFSVSDIEYLDDCIGPIQRKGKDVPILAVFIFHLLLLNDAQYILLQVPELSCCLIIHRLAGGKHLPVQHFHYFSVVPVQKVHCLVNVQAVFLRGNTTLARGTALPDLIIQARPPDADISRQVPGAVSDLIEFAEQFDGFLHCK